MDLRTKRVAVRALAPLAPMLSGARDLYARATSRQHHETRSRRRTGETGVCNRLHLCIGAQRSGTTWLFNNLYHMDSVFVPLVKEVRYWSSRRDAGQARAARDVAWSASHTGRDAARQHAWLDRWDKIDWDSPPSIDEYLALMQCDAGPSIDISPQYCLMSKRQVKALAAALPADSKVIYLLRDPLARAESQLKLHFHLHGRFRGAADPASYAALINRDDQLKRSDYAGTIRLWRRWFGDRLGVFYHDELDTDPAGFLKSLCDFLGIELCTDDLSRNTAKYFGTDRNQSYPSIYPAFHADTRTMIAKTILPKLSDFAALVPERGRPWLTAARATAAHRPARMSDFGLSRNVLDLMRMTESLGDNCEFGFWQRGNGYDPSSLFRWAVTPIESLTAFQMRPAKLFEMENLEPYSPQMVHDRAFGFKFHSKLVERDQGGELVLLRNESERAAVFAEERRKIDYLDHKFFRELIGKPALYVVKHNGGLSEKSVFELSARLRSYNAAHRLLWVETGGHAVLSEIGENIYRGELSRFAPYSAADDYDPAGWSALMTKLSQEPPIQEMIAAMLG